MELHLCISMSNTIHCVLSSFFFKLLSVLSQFFLTSLCKGLILSGIAYHLCLCCKRCHYYWRWVGAWLTTAPHHPEAITLTSEQWLHCSLALQCLWTGVGGCSWAGKSGLGVQPAAPLAASSWPVCWATQPYTEALPLCQLNSWHRGE